MNTFAQKYNRFLILIFSVAPFIGFFTITFLDMDFSRIMQLLSYLGVFLIIVFKDRNIPLKFPKYLLFYLLFILYVFYSDLYRLNREFKIMYLFGNQLIGGFNIMFIIENLIFPKKFFKRIFNISKLVVLIAFLVILVQQIISPDIFVNKGITAINYATLPDINEARLVSIYSWVGGLLKVGFAFVPIYLLIVEFQKKRNKNILFWLLIGLIFAFLSKARWIMVNTLLVFIVLYIQYKNRISFFFRYIFLIPIMIVITSVMLENSGVQVKQIVSERIFENDKKNLSQKSAGTRLLAVVAFNRLYWDHPIIGIGSIKYGMGGIGKQDYKLRSILKGRSSQIHIGYLSLLYMYGILGGFFFLGFLFLLLRELYNNAKITDYWSPFFGFFGFVLANITLVKFDIFEMGLIIVMSANRFIMQNTNSNKKQIAEKYL